MAVLTAGSILGIYRNEVTSGADGPLLQVIDIRPIKSGTGTSQQRYRLILSDGEAYQQAMLLQLTRAPKYTPGYWRAAPEPYVRDAMVYARLLQEREPEVAKLLHAACIVPEAYASKWFIGLCVHVLPFQALTMAMPPTPTSSPDPSPTHDPSPNSYPGPSLNPNPHPHPHPSPGPEQALFDFVEGFLKEGYLFLFKFSLAIVAATKAPLPRRRF